MNTTLDTTKMSVQQIRQYLMIDCHIPKETIDNIKGKSNLVNFMKSLNQADNMFQQEIEFKEEVIMPEQETKPTTTSPEWSNYVLAQLAEDEKDQGYPKGDGLRRLVEKLMGRIDAIETEVIQGPRPDNNYTSTVKTTIRLTNNNGTFIYSACADATKEYCPPPFDQHLSAIAETRAEGRAYRKILRLKNTTTREEMVTKNKENEDGTLISKNQKNIIDVLCRNDRLNINVQKVFNMLFGEKLINKYSFNEAAGLAEKLSEFQSNESLIPQNIRGYDPNWRD